MRPLTFIVGTGRSGSTALSRIINLHPDVLSINELFTSLGRAEAVPRKDITGEEFWELLARPSPGHDALVRNGAQIAEFLYLRRPGRFTVEGTGIPALSMMVLPHLTDDPDGLFDALAHEICAWPRRPAGQHFEAFFDTLCEWRDRTVAVERSGYSLHWVPQLRAAFPGAKFVHLFRDGPDCAVSMSRHPGFRMIALTAEILGLTGAASVAELTGSQVDALPPDLRELMTRRFDPRWVVEHEISPARLGRLWSRSVVDGVRHLEQVPADHRTSLGYEALLDDPERELTRLAAFIGVAPLPDWLAAGQALLDGGRRGSALRLPAEELTALRESCRPGTLALRHSEPRADAAVNSSASR
ncbi:hypothetical protein A6A06_01830 [Streptomyces sp. CB02923]|uniref:sulfotransferase family protein n=1 Tax=Streptomyces sp. CB02923 TaxID=1718985 RepID=UPI00093DAB1A|nr:sulfotransferase [Streptomyces sp. CB02923]OKI09465.1 hypothetical protein A6A06_01830 [Streptomyces sp. CB02923]